MQHIYEQRKKGGLDNVSRGVGSCKFNNCAHNTDYECHADDIHMKDMGKYIDSCTFSPK